MQPVAVAMKVTRVPTGFGEAGLAASEIPVQEPPTPFEMV
jgi:hypothetical protein